MRRSFQEKSILNSTQSVALIAGVTGQDGADTQQAGPQRFLSANPMAYQSAIAAAQTYVTKLQPGDVIACGTSLGVLPLKPGTLVEVSIDGLGVLKNTFVQTLSADA